MKNATVYREKGRFAGWPANYGIWSWGDEIVVGFALGYSDPAGGFHARDRSKPFVATQARSLDGGETWKVETTPCKTPGNRGVLSADEHVMRDLSAAQAIEEGLENIPGPCPGDVDFTHPDFAMMCARTGLGAGTTAWFYLSTDRCRSWQGPYSLPMFGQPGIEARTDYIVDGPKEMTLFLSASRVDGGEGAGVLAVRTTDGGKSFAMLGWVAQLENGFTIMPSSVRLSASRILTSVRCRTFACSHQGSDCWIDLFASDDNGFSFSRLATPATNTGRGGNPPMLNLLADGRLCLTYGYRDEPYGIQATLSEDGGMTWSEAIVLRDDAGNHDIGYCRSVQRPDGSMVTVYYYNDVPEGERFIDATIWRP